MKANLIQLLAALIGLFILGWGELKNYEKQHPITTTWNDLKQHQLKAITYYTSYIAYDPNNNKTWYLYSDGIWYDKPPNLSK
jgi:hypothetical protein